MAFIQLQADRKLGRAFAGLLPFVEGLHLMGYLSESQYEFHKKKYSIPLNKDPKQFTLEETKEAQERKQLNKMFGQVIAQWGIHEKKSWREKWVQKAREYGEIPNAKKLLAFVEESRG